jgi:hypothetical protein
MGVIQLSLNLAMSILMGGSPLPNGLFPVVINCLEETYIPIEAIDLCSSGVAFAVLIML